MAGNNRILNGIVKVINAKTTTGPGVALDVEQYKCVRFQLATQSSAAGTLKFAISSSEIQPDFSISPSYTNRYSFVQIVDYAQGNTIPGATGIVLTGTDVVANYEVNTNLIKWICPIMTAHSAGTWDMDCQAVNDYTR